MTILNLRDNLLKIFHEIGKGNQKLLSLILLSLLGGRLLKKVIRSKNRKNWIWQIKIIDFNDDGTECNRDLDWNLVKVARTVFSCHFWLLLMCATLFCAAQSLPDIGLSLKPNPLSQCKLVQMYYTHGSCCYCWAPKYLIFLKITWESLKQYFSFSRLRLIFGSRNLLLCFDSF